MIDLMVFGLFTVFGVACLVIVPLMMHPTLSPGKKLLLSLAAFFILVPAGIALYAWLGVPQMAQYS